LIASAAALDDQLQHAVELRLRADRAGDRGRRLEALHDLLELVAPLPQALVEVRVLDRDGGPIGQDDGGLRAGIRRSERSTACSDTRRRAR
jgi:hypothetical protein